MPRESVGKGVLGSAALSRTKRGEVAVSNNKVTYKRGPGPIDILSVGYADRSQNPVRTYRLPLGKRLAAACTGRNCSKGRFRSGLRSIRIRN